MNTSTPIYSVLMSYLLESSNANRTDLPRQPIDDCQSCIQFDVLISSLGMAMRAGLDVSAAGAIARAHVNRFEGYPHFEDERDIDIEIGQTILEMHQLVYPNDQIEEGACMALYMPNGLHEAHVAQRLMRLEGTLRAAGLEVPA